METNDSIFEEVKNYFSFCLRGSFAGLDGMTLTKIYYMFLTGIELISQSGQRRKILPIGLYYCYAMHTYFGRPAPLWEEDPFIKMRFTGEHVTELLLAAKTKLPAWMAARELAAKLLEQKDHIPYELQLLLVDEKSKPKRQQGRDFYDKLFRDFQIVLLLQSVEDSGLCIDRNPYASKENSLCDAMQLALKSIGILRSYEAIRSIWYKRQQHKSIFKEFPSPFDLLITSDLSVLNK